MTSRFVSFSDRFETRCKKCGSTDVDVSNNDCHECGITTKAECNKCGSKYDCHAFEQEEGEWVDNKWVKKEEAKGKATSDVVGIEDKIEKPASTTTLPANPKPEKPFSDAEGISYPNPKYKPEKICKKCGENENRPIKVIFINNNELSFACYEADKCSECGRIPTKTEVNESG